MAMSVGCVTASPPGQNERLPTSHAEFVTYDCTIEQSYKQVKQALGWAEYQVRGDVAIRRHWVLVWCAFSFCWWHLGHGAKEVPGWLDGAEAPAGRAPSSETGREKKSAGRRRATPAGVLASSVKEGARMVRALAHDRAVLAGVVTTAPAT